MFEEERQNRQERKESGEGKLVLANGRGWRQGDDEEGEMERRK